MGIFSKIYFGISNTITTDQGKLITGFAYGIGASIVIIGALFKILHLKGAEEMLMLGMGAEAFLFALGSFEPPHKEYDWSLVYPILSMGHGHLPGGEDVPPPDTTVRTSGAAPTAGVATSVNIDMPAFKKEDAEKLSNGIQKLTDTASMLNDLSDASVSTNKYISALDNAAASADSLSQVQEKGAVAVEKASENFSQSYDKVVTAFESSLSAVNTKSAEAFSKATEGLTAAYKSASESLKANIDSVNGTTKEMQSSLKGISSQLGQINSVYEMQLNSLNEQLAENKAQLNSAKAINSSLTSADTSSKAAAADLTAFSAESAKLKQQITDLNAVYGNMLNALNVVA